jgi:hypothetical protein
MVKSPHSAKKTDRPHPVIFISSAKNLPLLFFAQDGSQATANKAIERTEREIVSVFEICKPAFDGWIQIGYDLVDAVVSRSSILQVDGFV